MRRLSPSSKALNKAYRFVALLSALFLNGAWCDNPFEWALTPSVCILCRIFPRMCRNPRGNSSTPPASACQAQGGGALAPECCGPEGGARCANGGVFAFGSLQAIGAIGASSALLSESITQLEAHRGQGPAGIDNTQAALAQAGGLSDPPAFTTGTPGSVPGGKDSGAGAPAILKGRDGLVLGGLESSKEEGASPGASGAGQGMLEGGGAYASNAAAQGMRIPRASLGGGIPGSGGPSEMRFGSNGEGSDGAGSSVLAGDGADPEAYFLLIKSGDSIFEVVNRRYRAKQTVWMQLDHELRTSGSKPR